MTGGLSVLRRKLIFREGFDVRSGAEGSSRSFENCYFYIPVLVDFDQGVVELVG